MKDIKDLFLVFSSMEEIPLSKIFIKKLYDSLNNFFEIFNGDINQFQSKIPNDDIQRLKILKEELKKIELDQVKKNMELKKIRFVGYCDKDYPERLKEISDPPFGLFYRGDLNLFKKLKSVAIVGTRAATNYGLKISSDIASLLANQGIIIVSGLASGIDASAHAGAVKSGKTIAVLGTGVDIIFPISNEKLYFEILEKDGLIVSEYPLGTEGLPWNFPQRNRIISALSDAVVIIEGDIQSGAMITARFAIKQGKPLFALPGQIDSSVSNGPNILIKSGVGELLTSVNDILEKIGESKQIEIKFNDGKSNLDKLSEKQKAIFKLLSARPLSFDSLIEETRLNTQDLIKELSMMELRGVIEKTTDGGYIKC